MNRLLFVASEAFPLVKTGGLADVAGSLPAALAAAGVDVRLLLPAYGDLLAGLGAAPEVIAELDLGTERVRILQCGLPGSTVKVWLLEHPLFSARAGNPYHDEHGAPWGDSAERFALLSRAAACIATRDTPLAWRPHVLHCNDWHTGPAIALAQLEGAGPLTVFTVHNLAHQGVFDRTTFERLALPGVLWSEQGMEYYGQCSFMKAGLACADVITTVSPSYAREICAAPGGMGMEGLLRERSDRLVGIINGISTSDWDPGKDPALAHNYSADTLDAKRLNKAALQRELGLAARDDVPLIGFVGRLVEQKGLELLLPVLEAMLELPAQFAVLGKGDPRYESALRNIAAARPDSIALVLDYNEDMAHRIEAGADMFLMPSLFEPCGLNQMYSLRYGTPPIVRAVGGLIDTVTDAGTREAPAPDGTGFVFREPLPADLLQAVQRAVYYWADRPAWRALQQRGMAGDFSWQRSAAQYLEIYRPAFD